MRASDLACSRFSELAGEKRFGVFVSHFQGYSATTQQEKVTCAAQLHGQTLLIPTKKPKH